MSFENKNIGRYFSFLRRSKKSDGSNFGSSLVEMLGVLGIIGVLSMGGLSGYSKAMFSHRTTQTIDYFYLFLQKIAELKDRHVGEDITIVTGSDMISYGLIDECDEVRIRDHYSSCKMPMGFLNLTSSNESSHIKVFFTSPKECTAFMLAQWKRIIPEEWWQNLSGTMKVVGTGEHVFDTVNMVEDITVAEITNACQEQCNAGDCEVDFDFVGL